MTEDDKQRVRALFATMLRLMKSDAEITLRISSELAAVTGSVRGLDPSFDEVLEHRRQGVDELSDPLIREHLAQFDDTIRRVESGEFL